MLGRIELENYYLKSLILWIVILHNLVFACDARNIAKESNVLPAGADVLIKEIEIGNALRLSTLKTGKLYTNESFGGVLPCHWASGSSSQVLPIRC